MPASPAMPLPNNERRPRCPNVLRIASHVALWPGLYVLCSGVCVAQVAGLDELVQPARGTLAAGLAVATTIGVYLLDRVKLRDAWLDPADRAANAGRSAFVARNASALRVAVWVLLCAACLFASGLFEWGMLLPLIAALGVILYAPFPRTHRPRLKDLFFIKNVAVAVGITLFAAFVTIGAVSTTRHWADVLLVAEIHLSGLLVAVLFLGIRVLADAVLSDIDDEHSDRRHGTPTLPNRIGRAWSWNLAFASRIAAGLLLLSLAEPSVPRVAWGVVTVGSSITLRLASPRYLHDWVDARIVFETIAVSAVLLATHALR